MIFTFALPAQILYNSMIRVWEKWVTISILGVSCLLVTSGYAFLCMHLVYYSLSFYIRTLRYQLVAINNAFENEVGMTVGWDSNLSKIKLNKMTINK